MCLIEKLKSKSEIELLELLQRRFSSNKEIAIYSTKLGFISGIKYVISKGFIVKGLTGIDLIDLAAIYNHYNVIKFLLEKGADPNTNEGECIVTAAKIGNLEIVKLLLNKIKYSNSIHNAFINAASRNYLHIIKFLYNNYDLNIQYEDNEALKLASRNNNLDIINYLIEKGAKINDLTRVLSEVIFFKNNIPIMKSLLELEYDKSFSINDGKLLNLAVSNGNYEAIDLLIEYGIDVHTLEFYTFIKLLSDNKKVAYKIIQNGYTFTLSEINEMKKILQNREDLYIIYESKICKRRSHERIY